MNKKIKILFLILITITGVLILQYFYRQHAYKGYLSSTINISTELIKIHQNTFFDQFDKYNTSKENLQSSIIFPSEVSVYCDINDIDTNIAKYIPKEYWPYLKEDQFKVVIVVKSYQYKKIAAWSFDNKTAVKEIWSSDQ